MNSADDIGITKRKIIVRPCIVKIWLYSSAFSRVLSGWASCALISSASRPPMMKKKKATTPYMMPIFLWSTVVNQLQKPVIADGRRSSPRPPVAGTLRLAMGG